MRPVSLLCLAACVHGLCPSTCVPGVRSHLAPCHPAVSFASRAHGAWSLAASDGRQTDEEAGADLDVDFDFDFDDGSDDEVDGYTWDVPSRPAPRGFGLGSARLDDISTGDAAEAYGLQGGSRKTRARREAVLLRWADFVRGAGGERVPPSPPVAALRNVSVSIAGEPILSGVSWELCEGMIVGMVGESGCGKSTQLRLLAGELEPDEGSVWLAAPPHPISGRRSPDAIAHVRQEALGGIADERTCLRSYVERSTSLKSGVERGVAASVDEGGGAEGGGAEGGGAEGGGAEGGGAEGAPLHRPSSTPSPEEVLAEEV